MTFDPESFALGAFLTLALMTLKDIVVTYVESRLASLVIGVVVTVVCAAGVYALSKRFKM